MSQRIQRGPSSVSLASATGAPAAGGGAFDVGYELAGSVFAEKYRIVRLIGQGGVGLVYLAVDLETDAEVVIKLLAQTWMNDAEAVARFKREAERLSSLKHPNIVGVLDHGYSAERAYIVMDYVRGQTLADFVAERKRVSLEEFVPIAAQILKVLGHAHARELMVRDVKPSNVMLTESQGRANFVKFIDFGLAKHVRDDVQITQQHVVGTVGYLAPELLRGQQPDLRVDVYATGVLFYYMLSGTLPFQGDDTAAIFYKMLHEPVPDLAERLPRNHNVPQGLVTLIHQCLAKDPEERPPTANEIVERMIDVLPASLFRLPRAAADKVLPPGHGNTDLFDRASLGVLASRRATPKPEAAPPRVRKSPVLIAGFAGGVLSTGALAVWLGTSASSGSEATDASRDAAPATAPATTQHSPTPQPEVLPTEPAKAAAEQTREQQPLVPQGDVQVDSEPRAFVRIDGESRGRTPFTGKLPVGTHTVEISAKGYVSREWTLDVQEEKNESVMITLVPAKPGRPAPSKAASAAPASAAATDSRQTKPVPAEPVQAETLAPKSGSKTKLVEPTEADAALMAADPDSESRDVFMMPE